MIQLNEPFEQSILSMSNDGILNALYDKCKVYDNVMDSTQTPLYNNSENSEKERLLKEFEIIKQKLKAILDDYDKSVVPNANLLSDIPEGKKRVSVEDIVNFKTRIQTGINAIDIRRLHNKLEIRFKGGNKSKKSKRKSKRKTKRTK